MRRIYGESVRSDLQSRAGGHLPPNCTYTHVATRTGTVAAARASERARGRLRTHTLKTATEHPLHVPAYVRVLFHSSPLRSVQLSRHRPSPSLRLPVSAFHSAAIGPRVRAYQRRLAAGTLTCTEAGLREARARESAFYVGRLHARRPRGAGQRDMGPLLQGVARGGASYRVTAIQATKSKYS